MGIPPSSKGDYPLIKEISMLTTIMITLLCIWLAIMILGQIIGGVIGYKVFKSLTSEEETK